MIYNTITLKGADQKGFMHLANIHLKHKIDLLRIIFSINSLPAYVI